VVAGGKPLPDPGRAPGSIQLLLPPSGQPEDHAQVGHGLREAGFVRGVYGGEPLTDLRGLLNSGQCLVEASQH